MKSPIDILEENKKCPRCGWLFLDTSKNGKCKWYDMNEYGNLIFLTRADPGDVHKEAPPGPKQATFNFLLETGWPSGPISTKYLPWMR